ncbi:MAG: hypothetical protein K1X89_29785 [Myxococcaceae bacterium]|nr:hypothetical protein [Myxococcaceae bacterium]
MTLTPLVVAVALAASPAESPAAPSATAADQPPKPAAAQMLEVGNLKLEVPAGWTVAKNPELLLELRAGPDGNRGVLQVSKNKPDDATFLRSQKDLGALAEKFGQSLGTRGQNWGKPIGNKQTECAMGRLGIALFAGGEFPSMIILQTVGSRGAYLWTWLGPDPKAAEVEQTLRLVMAATEVQKKETK